jgi:hypothetical protein
MARLCAGRPRIRSISGMGKRFCCFLGCPDWLWDQQSSYSLGTGTSLSGGKATEDEIDMLLPLKTELTMVQLCLRSKIGLHGVHRAALLFFDTHYEIIHNFLHAFLSPQIIYKAVHLTSLTVRCTQYGCLHRTALTRSSRALNMSP